MHVVHKMCLIKKVEAKKQKSATFLRSFALQRFLQGILQVHRVPKNNT